MLKKKKKKNTNKYLSGSHYYNFIIQKYISTVDVCLDPEWLHWTCEKRNKNIKQYKVIKYTVL